MSEGGCAHHTGSAPPAPVLRTHFADASGGLGYHLRALRFRHSLWAPYIATVQRWLHDWRPPTDTLVVVGPSAGYALDAAFLARFRSVRALEPDPLARTLLRRRFAQIAWHFDRLDYLHDGGGPGALAAAYWGVTQFTTHVGFAAAAVALAERGLRPEDVHATGPGGRILKEDVARAPERAAAATPPRDATVAPAAAPSAAAPAGTREEEVVPMSPLRRRVAERLVAAQHTAALLTTFNEVDMSAVMALRSAHKDAFEKRHGVRLGFMSFFVKATIEALRAFPQLNAEIREQAIVYKNYYDIGVAVSTPKGLMVPVLRDADRLSFAEVEAAIGDFGKRSQANKIAPEELQGGTFTITNGGVFGSLLSTPIVNPPQSGVLGMHAIQDRPVAVKGQVVIRPMMYVALTYDHRIVDGREAVTFLRRIKEAIEEPARILLEV